jgi:hypothetical protein
MLGQLDRPSSRYPFFAGVQKSSLLARFLARLAAVVPELAWPESRV